MIKLLHLFIVKIGISLIVSVRIMYLFIENEMRELFFILAVLLLEIKLILKNHDKIK